ncbi:hypothetical protein ACFO5O_07630 [Geojedonia litorea]|uniref:Nicotinate-nucleotide adenylyltransferase n=1 Tax=Geojedonia litorea TaxID=1268269 RepID=A0ABV9N3Z5_9FLAO
MKTRILGIILLGVSSLLYSQNDIAALSTPSHKLTTKTKLFKNTAYLNAIHTNNHAIKVQKLQNVVASYDIKNEQVYNAELQTTYTVEFKEGANYIKAIYNRDGQLISCLEKYNDIRLPVNLSIDLAKTYPGWEFNNVQCSISYQQNTNSKIDYQVVLKKGKKSKTVHFKA